MLVQIQRAVTKQLHFMKIVGSILLQPLFVRPVGVYSYISIICSLLYRILVLGIIILGSQIEVGPLFVV